MECNYIEVGEEAKMKGREVERDCGGEGRLGGIRVGMVVGWWGGSEVIRAGWKDGGRKRGTGGMTRWREEGKKDGECDCD